MRENFLKMVAFFEGLKFFNQAEILRGMLESDCMEKLNLTAYQAVYLGMGLATMLERERECSNTGLKEEEIEQIISLITMKLADETIKV